jgi:hypothetical protein
MLRRCPQRNALALRHLDLNTSAVRGNTVVRLGRGRAEGDVVAVRREDLADAANKMAVQREPSSWKQHLELRHERVEPAHEFGDLINGRERGVAHRT